MGDQVDVEKNSRRLERTSKTNIFINKRPGPGSCDTEDDMPVTHRHLRAHSQGISVVVLCEVMSDMIGACGNLRELLTFAFFAFHNIAIGHC